MSVGNSVKRHTIFGCGILWPKSVTESGNLVALESLDILQGYSEILVVFFIKAILKF